MSFSADVKNECARIKNVNVSGVIAELAAYIPMCGALKLTRHGLVLRFNTENAAIGRRIFTFLKNFYSGDVDVKVSQSKQLKKNNIYTIAMNDTNAVRVLLYDTAFVTDDNVFTPNYMPYSVLRTDEEERAYVRASFLGAGSISNPEKYYHLEFVSSTLDHSHFLQEILSGYGLGAKVTGRKESFITYIKGAEQIADTLALMGAQMSVLKFENIRVLKDVNNNVNRLVNMESANLNKIVNSSVAQVQDIELIQQTCGLDTLPEGLRDVAILRLADESLSLKELGERLKPPIGKSGVNHRFKKLRAIANQIRGEHDGYKDSKIEQ
ncbi:DNA-binding protein WhiA [Peptoniphilus equinus]|uniref:Probable cell division protein WhiA n=1 Tax=Peptoniphilus equinus TaxID=3016343 RepID=A0ABY7QSM7_9FIRM|nr:DNA-binding protein WhiA [Peptoniphilus equinus]WBW49787.1 DNA-binding protein WhiA [Peptoniphilus equinus]